MVPHLAKEGSSFYGAFLYYCHDKNSSSRKRIGFTETLNMLTDSVDKAWKVMTYTARSANQLKKASGQRSTGAKLRKAVFSYSLSWHPEQTPTKEHMLEAAKESLDALGLGEHEAMIVEHLDEPQPHLHVVVNKVHPLTGLVAKLKYTKEKISDFAHKLQQKEGVMYCPQREENRRKRENGEKSKYSDPVVSEAWQRSESGHEFIENLEKRGHQLAQGRKCIVVVDSRGKPSNAARILNLKTREFKAKLGQAVIDNLKSYEQATKDLEDAAVRSQQKVQQKTDLYDASIEFEERKAVAFNQLTLRQYDELSTLSSQHDREILSTRDDLGKFYNLKRKQSEIERLERKVEKPGFIQKLIGLHKRRVLRLEELKYGLSNAQMRFDDAIGNLETKKSEALQDLKVVHSQQRDALESNFEQWRPMEPKTADRASPTPNRSISQGLSGPDFER